MDTEVSRKTHSRWAIAASAVILAWWLWATSRLALTPGDGLVYPAVLPSPVGCASSDRVMFAAIAAAIMVGVFALGVWWLSRPITRPWAAWSAAGTFAIAALTVYQVVLFQ